MLVFNTFFLQEKNTVPWNTSSPEIPKQRNWIDVNKTGISHQQLTYQRYSKNDLSQQLDVGKVIFIIMNAFFRNHIVHKSYKNLNASCTNRKREGLTKRVFFFPEKKKKRTILIPWHFINLPTSWNIPACKKICSLECNQYMEIRRKLEKMEVSLQIRCFYQPENKTFLEEDQDFVLQLVMIKEGIDPSQFLQKRNKKCHGGNGKPGIQTSVPQKKLFLRSWLCITTYCSDEPLDLERYLLTQVCKCLLTHMH